MSFADGHVRTGVRLMVRGGCLPVRGSEKKGEFNGTSMHLLDGYISANQRFFSTFLSKITKYNRVHLGFDPSVARLLGHDPTPRPT